MAGGTEGLIIDADDTIIAEIRGYLDSCGNGDNADWLALLNPVTVIALLDRIEALEKERDFLRQKSISNARERNAAEAICGKLEKALQPFAKAGQVIDSPFGPALFREDDMAFQSGCAWSENGERRTITWGDFRRARAALAEDKLEGDDGNS